MCKNKKFQEALANSFLDILESDPGSWTKGWDARSSNPANAETEKNYKGTNRVILALAAKKFGYKDSRWATFNQIASRKWSLKKGSKGVPVEYWYPFDKANGCKISWKEYDESSKDPERFVLTSRCYTVFNGDCIEGIPKLEELPEHDINPDALIDSIADNMGVPLYKDDERAFYSPVKDEIHGPEPCRFHSDYEYGSTYLHELAHATGHKTRLNRKQLNAFGSEDYAYEELVAEIASCLSSTGLGSPQTEEHLRNHRAYVKNWASAIKENNNVLVRAINDAQKASDMLDENAMFV